MEDPKVKVEEEEKTGLVNTRMRLVIELERTYDPNRSKNQLHMTMDGATFTNPDTEEKVGEVLHGIPAHTIIRDAETKEDWRLHWGELFSAYKSAREEFEKDEPEEDVILKVDEEDPDNNKVGC